MRNLCGTILAAAVALPAVPAVADAVSIAPGFDWTNIVVRVDGVPDAEVSLVDSSNAEVGLDDPLDLGAAYAYDVRQDGVSVASGAFAMGSDGPQADGTWTVEPENLEDGSFGITNFAGYSFSSPLTNHVTRTDMRFRIDGWFRDEDSELDSPEDGFAGIAAVAGEGGRPEWRVWNGSAWIPVYGPSPRKNFDFAVRLVMDFSKDFPRTCYLVSEDGGETYTVLHTAGGDAWIASAASGATCLSSMDFDGEGAVAGLEHRAIDGTATARYTVAGEETYGSLADALSATPTGSDAAITLLTNVTWPEGGPQYGDWIIDRNGYSLVNVPDGVNIVEDCSKSLEFLCNPNMARWSGTSDQDNKARMMTSLYVHNGRIYTSGGDWNANIGPCPVWAVDPVTGVFVDEYDAASERLDWFVEDSAGRLYTPFTDISEKCPEQAAFARRGLDGKWRPMQIWPGIEGQIPVSMFDSPAQFNQGYAVHTWGLAAWKGRIFTAGYGIAWGWEGSDEVMSNATTSVTTPNITYAITNDNNEVVASYTFEHCHRFKSFLPFENDLFCLPMNRYNIYGYKRDPEVWRFDEGTGQFVPESYEWDEIAPMNWLQDSWVSPIHQTIVAGRMLYIMASEFVQAPSSGPLYSAVVENHRIRAERITLVGENPRAIIRRGDHVAVMTSRRSTPAKVGDLWGWDVSVWESADGLNFRRRFVLRSMVRDFTAFAYHDGCWYFGSGNNRARRATVVSRMGIDTEPLPDGDDNSGDIYRLRDPALADLPAVEAEGAVVVQEGGRGVARFRLDKRPSAAIVAPVRAALGVPALLPEVTEVVFTPDDWNEWHEVPFAADDDAIDIVKDGAIVCGGSDSGCTWGAAGVKVENNDFRVVETRPDGLVDLTRPDGKYSVGMLVLERDNLTALWKYGCQKDPFNDDTSLTNGCLRIKSRPRCDVEYEFERPTVVDSYGIYLNKWGYGNSGGTSVAPPRMWTFSGSNDGENWKVLDSRSCETDWKGGEYRYYSFRNRRAFRKYRIAFGHDGNTCAAFIQLSHMEFHGHAAKPMVIIMK